MTHECPLCGTDFEESKCPSSCPMAHGCAMTRCPRCGYEFVENGTVAAKVRNWWTSFVTLVGEAAERRGDAKKESS